MGLLNLNRALYNFVYVVVSGLIGCMAIRLIRRLEVPRGERASLSRRGSLAPTCRIVTGAVDGESGGPSDAEAYG